MGSLGQVEGVQMGSRKETPAVLTVEKEKALWEVRKNSDRKKGILYLFFLRRKSKNLCEEKQRGKRRKNLSNELQRQLGFNLRFNILQLSWRIQLFSKKMAGLKEKRNL